MAQQTDDDPTLDIANAWTDISDELRDLGYTPALRDAEQHPVFGNAGARLDVQLEGAESIQDEWSDIKTALADLGLEATHLRGGAEPVAGVQTANITLSVVDNL